MDSDERKAFNQVIPFDDLHWFEEEKKFAAIAPEELDAILESCALGGIIESEDTLAAVRWAEKIRVGNSLLNGILAQRLIIVGFDEEEPIFAPTPELEEN